MEDYAIEYEPGWDVHFNDFDRPIQERMWKKILKMRAVLKTRHLKHGFPYFVEEVGGYRIVFEVFEKEKIRKIIFVGDHKQYQRWYKSL